MIDIFTMVVFGALRLALRALGLVVLLTGLFTIVSYGAWEAYGPATFPLYGLASIALVLVFMGAIF